jgi:hypothetical protein
LSVALERGQRVFDAGIDADLDALGDLIDQINSAKAPDELICDPLMRQVRERASEILRAIDRFDQPPGRSR